MKLHNVISFGMIFVCFGYGAFITVLDLGLGLVGLDMRKASDVVETGIKEWMKRN